jgi:hypothetical protein
MNINTVAQSLLALLGSAIALLELARDVVAMVLARCSTSVAC